MTKTIFKESLIELIQEQPLAKITIKEICEHADMNRSTFYLHYTDQYMLLQDIENDILASTHDYLKNISSRAGTLDYLYHFLLYIKENHKIFGTLLCISDNAAFRNDFTIKTLEHIKTQLHFTCSSQIQKYIYSYLMQGSMQIIIEWINSRFDADAMEIAQLLFRLSDGAVSHYVEIAQENE